MPETVCHILNCVALTFFSSVLAAVLLRHYAGFVFRECRSFGLLLFVLLNTAVRVFGSQIVYDVGMLKSIAETNRFAALGYASRLLSKCDWRTNDNAVAETSAVLDDVITNLFNETLITNSIRLLDKDILLRSDILWELDFRTDHRGFLLSTNSLKVIAEEIGSAVGYDINAITEGYRRDFPTGFSTNDPYRINVEWKDYRNDLKRISALNRRLARFRSELILRIAPSVKMHGGRLPPEEAAAFTNDFIRAAGLSTDEVRKIFGE